jgi:GNAT superfamily N-acetyltransferase
MTQVRACLQSDVPRLEHQIPSPGPNRFHEARFQRHQNGLSTFLIAVVNDTPVGCGEILWRGCGAPEVTERCPELSGLTVQPARQSQGIGTAIIRTAEQFVLRRGHHRLGLGVDDENDRAAALYLRLGYQDIGCHYIDRYPYLDEQGALRTAADPCRFLVKTLADPM